LTAATAPLIANTNVPPRSSTATRMCVMPSRSAPTTRNYTPTRLRHPVRDPPARSSWPVPGGLAIGQAGFALLAIALFA
jgi:hypothetical protein